MKAAELEFIAPRDRTLGWARIRRRIGAIVARLEPRLRERANAATEGLVEDRPASEAEGTFRRRTYVARPPRS